MNLMISIFAFLRKGVEAKDLMWYKLKRRKY